MQDGRTRFHQSRDVALLLTELKTEGAVANLVLNAVRRVVDQVGVIFVQEAENDFAVEEGFALEAIIKIDVRISLEAVLKAHVSPNVDDSCQ